jgi:hypothetical protein
MKDQCGGDQLTHIDQQSSNASRPAAQQKDIDSDALRKWNSKEKQNPLLDGMSKDEPREGLYASYFKNRK